MQETWQNGRVGLLDSHEDVLPCLGCGTTSRSGWPIGFFVGPLKGEENPL